MAIDSLVLGAGQEVGKSCVIVTINGKRIMFDCGMHMGHLDHRRYPDFSLIGPNFNQTLTCIIITHFHLDHIGALPYFTEVCGYSGPIYMTYPTKALAPLMLEDYRKVMVERRGEEEQFTSEHIVECMKKVIPVDLKQTVQVDKDLQIRAYYAGHVLGAAMFYAKVGDAAMVYTGDYNMTPDRHLGAAQIDRLSLDLVITESTYATTIRDSKYAREREFLRAVHTCVAGGGKVLIPSFALGRAQELCILLEDYWERMNLKVPIYFSAGLTRQANMYYKMLISWTSQKIKETYSTHNAFDFKNVHKFERSMIDAPGPCVLFATPGMISGGFSLEVFKHWAPSEKNLVTMPGYCVAGTIGHKLMSGKPTKIDLDKNTRIDVRCQIHQLTFSPHTDAKGIMDLVKFLSPKHVILVHGEKPKMATLKGRIQSELGIQCYDPANNETVSVPSTHYATAVASDAFVQSCSNPNLKFSTSGSEHEQGSSSSNRKSIPRLQVSNDRVAEGILVMEKNKKAKVVHQDELLVMLEEKKHQVNFAYCCPAHIGNVQETVSVPSTHYATAVASDAFVRSCSNPNFKFSTSGLEHEQGSSSSNRNSIPRLQVSDDRVAEGILVMEKNKKAKVVHQDELLVMLEEKKHQVKFAYCCPTHIGNLQENQETESTGLPLSSTNNDMLQLLSAKLTNELSEVNIQDFGDHLQVESFRVSICSKEDCPYRLSDNGGEEHYEPMFFCCSWAMEDEKLAWKVISMCQK